ncbi:dihydroneopterin aldolase [Corynebacterium auriscanis]|uniref:dihydroneopterin aldolase n=1 Tax=Corynebacterium auriscanis TaxID=99807 RepID=UPI0024AE0114|nr:dihydroneopterin aldolase [Corynebacterium auriscanis]
MADRIELIGLEAYGYHGVFDHEKAQGQKFLIDIVVWTDFGASAHSDELADTISYVDLADIAVEEVQSAGSKGAGHDLIETLASRIADRINDIAGVHAVEVTVHKPQAPIEYPFSDVRVVARRNAKSRG